MNAKEYLEGLVRIYTLMESVKWASGDENGARIYSLVASDVRTAVDALSEEE